MKFTLLEDILEEATFTGSDTHLYNHYGTHVLFDGDKFDINDPRFPYMTLEEYITGAEELSEHKADSINSGSLYIGGKLDFKNRLIKIRTQSKYKTGPFMDVVVYTDEPNEQVYTFMLCKRSKLQKYINSVVSELPENIVEDND